MRRKRLEPMWAHANTTQPVLGMSDFHMFLKSDTSPLGAITGVRLGGDTLEQLPDLGDTFENSMPELVMPAEEDWSVNRGDFDFDINSQHPFMQDLPQAFGCGLPAPGPAQPCGTSPVWDDTLSGDPVDAGIDCAKPPSDRARPEQDAIWGSMETLVAPKSLVVAPSSACGPPPTQVIRVRLHSCATRCHDITFAPTAAAADLLSQLRSTFELPPASACVLRDAADGCVVPPSPAALADGRTYDLETPSSVRGSSLSASDTLVARSSPIRLVFMQEPPKGSAECLTITVNQDGAPKPLRHTFAIEVGIAADQKEGQPGAALTEAERKWLQNARIRLFNPAMQECSELLFSGPKIVKKNSVSWPTVGITKVSSSASLFCPAAAVMSQLRGKMAYRGGRCAQGWYHICVSSPGVADLWLGAHSDLGSAAPGPRGESDAARGKGDMSAAAQLISATKGAVTTAELGRLIVKDKRCFATGRWAEKKLGPYSDHSACRPTHIGRDGVRLCVSGCC